MRIVFRTDCSLQIGTGHVMRCLTLADAMRHHGAQCHFVCRPHHGHLLDLIHERGYHVLRLPTLCEGGDTKLSSTANAGWLGVDWATDAADTLRALNNLASKTIDWLVVDHYALDHRWEKALRSTVRRILVIDDLADRAHDCDVLVDQTYGRDTADYRLLVPDKCNILCGSKYALLRPEFLALRPYSLQRRLQPDWRELLIAMGGVDKDNATGRVLHSLHALPILANCKITVVMGRTAPWLDEIRSQAEGMPWPIRVLAGVDDMAQLMADSDIAIGAAGATSWERCCLGLPSVMVVLAENQLKVAQGLHEAGAAALVSSSTGAEYRFGPIFDKFALCPQELHAMSSSAARIVDGTGTNSIAVVLAS